MVELVPNRFVEGFIHPNGNQLAQLGEVAAEINEEHQAWIQSGAAEQLAGQKFQVLGWDGVSPLNPKDRQAEIARMRGWLFGRVSGVDNFNRAANLVEASVVRQLQRDKRLALEALTTAIIDHRNQYTNSISDLTQQRAMLDKALTDSWVQFIAADYSHLAHFRVFLSEEEYTPLRTHHRPFLEALERQREQSKPGSDILLTATRDPIDRACQNPPVVVFEQFLQELKLAQNKRDGSDIFEWLGFAVFPLNEIDADSIVSRIRESGIFPTGLRRLFAAFLQTNLGTEIEQIRQLMAAYKEAPNPLILSMKIRTLQKRQKDRISFTNEVAITNKLSEIPPRPEYIVLLNGETAPSKENLERLIIRTASQLAPNDPRMLADVRALIDTLRQDPYGLGASKLTPHTISSQYSERRAALWHYRADKKPGVKLQHPEAWRLRAVYYFDHRFNPQAVILTEVIHHDEADRKFTS